MAEILVLAVERTHEDPERARRGLHQKGDIIQVMPDGHAWGEREGLPTFVLVRCPQATVEQVRDRTSAWAYAVTFTVVGSNLAVDGHRIRMSNANAGASGVAGLTLEKVQTFLSRWGAVFVSAQEGSVTFDVTIGAAAQSVGFWGAPLHEVVLQEVAADYVQATGLHRLTATYDTNLRWLDSPLSFEREVRSRIRAVGGTVETELQGVTTFTVTRADVRERFRAQVEEALGTYQRHRYHFTAAQVDTVVAQGGSVTLTAAQLVNAVQDRLTE